MMLNKCRCCGNEKLKSVISLGESPLANNLSERITQEDQTYPLEMMYCEECHNCQLSCVVPPEKLFENYLYVSSTAKSFRDHFENAAIHYIEKFSLNENSLVVDIGSNDGISLRPLKDRGIKILGVDPAVNVAKIANDSGIETLNSYFDTEAANTILEKYGKSDIVTASNVFAHSDFVKEIANDAFRILKTEGAFIVEVQYLLDTIKDLTFDNIYHEHVNYWSVTSIKNMFEKLGYEVFHVEHVDTHGGSIRVYVQNPQAREIEESVNLFLEEEKNFGLQDFSTYEEFAKRILREKHNVNQNFKMMKDRGMRIVGYGSPAKATTALNFFETGTQYLDFIVEDNSLKHGKFLPTLKIPILPKAALSKVAPDVVVIMAWNFAAEIVKNNQDLVERGIKFVSIKDLGRENFEI
jgi:hypothetical protein